MEKQVLNTRLNCTLHICVTSFNRTLIIFRPYIYRLLNQRLSRNRFITWFVNWEFIHPIFNLPKVLPFFSFISNVLLSVILFFYFIHFVQVFFSLCKHVYYFACEEYCRMEEKGDDWTKNFRCRKKKSRAVRRVLIYKVVFQRAEDNSGTQLGTKHTRRRVCPWPI